MGRDRTCCAVSVALLAISVLRAEPAWGPNVAGLTLRVDIGATYGNEKRLRIHFRNSGATPVELGVGGASGSGSMYSVDMISTARGGKVCKLLDTTVGFVGGYVAPIVIRLAPGATD